MIHEGPLLEYAGRDLALPAVGRRGAALARAGARRRGVPAPPRAVRCAARACSPLSLGAALRGARADRDARSRRCGSCSCRGCSPVGCRARAARPRRAGWSGAAVSGAVRSGCSSRSGSASPSSGGAAVAIGLVTAQALLLASRRYRGRRGPRRLSPARRARLRARRAGGAPLPARRRARASRARCAPATRPLVRGVLAIALALAADLARAAARARRPRGRARRARALAFGSRPSRRAGATLLQMLGIVARRERRSRSRRSRLPGGLPLLIELGVAARPDPGRARRRRLPRADLRRVRQPATPRSCGACVTSRDADRVAVPAVPLPPAAVGVAPRAARRRSLARRQRGPCGRARRCSPASRCPRRRPPAASRAGMCVDAGRRAAPRRHRGSSAWPARSSRLPTCGRAATLVRPPARRTPATTPLLYVFWAALLAVPLAGNLGAAWLLIEATTATSALLVAFSGKARALEAGWKYLDADHARPRRSPCSGSSSSHAGDPRRRPRRARPGSALAAPPRPAAQPRWSRISCSSPASPRKIGWAPVHNWLPDAHCEAPAAGLGAALRGTAADRAARRLAHPAGARAGDRRGHRPERLPRLRAASRSRSRSRSSGGRWRGSGCSPTRASSTWA